jgi:DNA-binding CsgD family transcriptional regulator
MTIHSLYPPVQRLARCRTVTDVSGVAIDGMRAAFGSHVGAAIFFDESLQTTDLTVFGARDVDLEEYQRDWRSTDLVCSAVVERAVPVHNWEVYREDAPPPLYTQFGRRLDLYHYLSAPLFGAHGTIVGFLNVCRRARLRPFAAMDTRLAGSFAGFISATLARVRAEASRSSETSATDMLTAREWQVARLAAAGRNNLEIALQLGLARETVKHTLRRVFRKLGANGRAQMVAKLASRGLL